MHHYAVTPQQPLSATSLPALWVPFELKITKGNVSKQLSTGEPMLSLFT